MEGLAAILTFSWKPIMFAKVKCLVIFGQSTLMFENIA